MTGSVWWRPTTDTDDDLLRAHAAWQEITRYVDDVRLGWGTWPPERVVDVTTLAGKRYALSKVDGQPGLTATALPDRQDGDVIPGPDGAPLAVIRRGGTR